MFGYIDESGAPGVATYNKDCLVVSLVLFDSEESRDKSIAAIDNLRENYVFLMITNFIVVVTQLVLKLSF